MCFLHGDWVWFLSLTATKTQMYNFFGIFHSAIWLPSSFNHSVSILILLSMQGLFFLSYGAIQIKWCSYYCCQSNQTLDHVQCSSVSGSILILYASFHCHSLGLLITQASEQNVPSLSLISHKKKTDKQRWLTIRLRIIRSSVTSRGSCTSHY